MKKKVSVMSKTQTDIHNGNTSLTVIPKTELDRIYSTGKIYAQAQKSYKQALDKRL